MKKVIFTAMSYGFFALILLPSCVSKKSSFTNMVARMEVKEPIDGVCDNANVIAILPFPGNGQLKAIAPKTDSEITDELNAQVSFLKEKPDYEDKGMVNLIINCKGEMVRCQIDNKTQSPELDAQIVAVFAALKNWSPGKINGKAVDTSVLISFKINKGKISLS